jgi:hypothetical protein
MKMDDSKEMSSEARVRARWPDAFAWKGEIFGAPGFMPECLGSSWDDAAQRMKQVPQPDPQAVRRCVHGFTDCPSYGKDCSYRVAVSPPIQSPSELAHPSLPANTPGEMGLPPLDVTEEDRQAAMRELENIKTDGVTLRGFVNILKCRERQLRAALRQQPQPVKGFEGLPAGVLEIEHRALNAQGMLDQTAHGGGWDTDVWNKFTNSATPQNVAHLVRDLRHALAASQQPQVPEDVQQAAARVADISMGLPSCNDAHVLADFVLDILSLTGGRDGK